MRVLIADDHAIVRKGLESIVKGAYPQCEVGETDSARMTMERALGEKWDLILLDISLPDLSGLAALQRIRAECPQVPVLVLSVHSENLYALRALKMGAGGYLTKDVAPEKLVQAIKKILAGGVYVSDDLALRMVADLNSGKDMAPHERLSQREFQVFERIASGMTVGQIASAMNLSVKTISAHRRRLLDRMGLRNNAEIMRYAATNHLFEGESAVGGMGEMH